MNKADIRRRDEAIAAFMRAYKLEFEGARDLVDKLMVMGKRAQRNAENLCNLGDYKDRRDSIARSVRAVLTDAGIETKFKVGGDPRGFCLKIVLPDGNYNTWGGAEEGWGF